MTDNKLADALHVLLAACDDSDSAMYGTLGVSFVRDVAQAALAEHDAGKAGAPWPGRVPIAWSVETNHYGRGYVFSDEFIEAFPRFPLPPDPLAAMLATPKDAPAPVQPPAPEPHGEFSLHDRIEFALRDAGFDLDEASRLAIAALQQKVGWQPIETAPKDGRTIILAHETSFLGFWDISQKAWCDHRKFYRDPSRWMALPPIPATGSEGEGNV